VLYVYYNQGRIYGGGGEGARVPPELKNAKIVIFDTEWHKISVKKSKYIIGSLRNKNPYTGVYSKNDLEGLSIKI